MDKCTLCPLHKDGCRTNCIPGRGRPGGVMLIGEAPGATEDIAGKPFVGDAGRILDSMITDSGLDNYPVFITNVARCRPRENRKPKIKGETRVCTEAHLVDEIKRVRPRMIMTLGVVALHTLTGQQKIWNNLGSWFKSEYAPKVPILANLHPAAILHSRKDQEMTAAALERVFDLAAQFMKTHKLTKELPQPELVEETPDGWGGHAIVDIETTRTDVHDPAFRMMYASIAYSPGTVQGFILPEQWHDLLDVVLSCHKIGGWNFKFDAGVLLHFMSPKERNKFLGIDWADPMLLVSLDMPGYKSLRLTHHAKLQLGVRDWKNPDDYDALARGKLTNGMKHICHLDAALTYALWNKVPKGRPIDHWVCNDVLKTAVKMESRGVYLDQDEINRQYARNLVVRNSSEHFLRNYVDNPGSNPQVGTFLKTVLSKNTLSAMGWTKTGQLSLDKEALYALEQAGVKHPFVKHLTLWKKAGKSINPYLKRMDEAAPVDHPDIFLVKNQEGRSGIGGAVTGRITMSLYATFRRDGMEKRCVVSAKKGGRIVVLDYVQSELLVAADIANCKRMLRLIREGADLHAETAKAIFNRPHRDDEERQCAKRTNFATIYDVTPPGLSAQLWALHHIQRSPTDCQGYIGGFFRLYPEFSEYHLRIRREVQRHGRVIGPTGRILRTHEPRQAINAPVQGGSADLDTALMVLCWQHGYPAFINQYDSVGVDIGYADDSAVDRLVKLATEDVVQYMADKFGWRLKVQPRVEAKVATHWQ